MPGTKQDAQRPTMGFDRLAALLGNIAGRTIERVFLAEYDRRHFRMIFTFTDGTAYEFFGTGDINGTGGVEHASADVIRARLARDTPIQCHEVPAAPTRAHVPPANAPPPLDVQAPSPEVKESPAAATNWEPIRIVDEAGTEWLVVELHRSPFIDRRSGKPKSGRTSAVLLFTSATQRRYATDYIEAFPKNRDGLLMYLRVSTVRPDGLDACTLPSGRRIPEGVFRPEHGDEFFLPDILHQPGVQLPSTNDEACVEEPLEPLDSEGRTWLIRDNQDIECVIELRAHGGWWWREDRKLPPGVGERSRAWDQV